MFLKGSKYPTKLVLRTTEQMRSIRTVNLTSISTIALLQSQAKFCWFKFENRLSYSALYVSCTFTFRCKMNTQCASYMKRCNRSWFQLRTKLWGTFISDFLIFKDEMFIW